MFYKQETVATGSEKKKLETENSCYRARKNIFYKQETVAIGQE